MLDKVVKSSQNLHPLNRLLVAFLGIFCDTTKAFDHSLKAPTRHSCPTQPNVLNGVNNAQSDLLNESPHPELANDRALSIAAINNFHIISKILHMSRCFRKNTKLPLAWELLLALLFCRAFSSSCTCISYRLIRSFNLLISSKLA